MGDVLNIFTKQITEVFGTAVYDQKVTLTPIDKAYFAVRSFTERFDKPFDGPFKEFPKIDDDGWAKVDISKDGPTRIDFQFLEDMGLAVRRGDEHYINKFAYFLYDPQDGLFANYKSNNKKGIFAPFLRTMLTYVLPGEYWMTYYDEQLSDHMRAARLIEIKESWNDIKSHL